VVKSIFDTIASAHGWKRFGDAGMEFKYSASFFFEMRPETMMANSRSICSPTGPRTPQGKRRVRLNALNHGIFAEIVFGEGKFQTPVEDFDNLVHGLRRTFQPTNPFAVMLIDQLAITLIRLAKLYAADSEIAPTFFRRLQESTDDASTSVITASIEKADQVAFFHRGPSLEVLIKYEASLDRKVAKLLDQLEQVRRIGSGDNHGMTT
jgi:hypothetical protein